MVKKVNADFGQLVNLSGYQFISFFEMLKKIGYLDTYFPKSVIGFEIQGFLQFNKATTTDIENKNTLWLN